MAITLVNKVTLTPSGSSGGTTAAINTIGANCFVAVCAGYRQTSPPDVTDSLDANLFSRIVDEDDASATRISIYVKLNPVTGASHTFSAVPSFGTPFCTMTVLCYAGVDTDFGVDQISAGDFSVASTTVQTGSLTPGADGSVIVAGLGVDAGTPPPSINSSFTLQGQVPWSSGVYFGHGAFDLIQSTAGAVNPTITYSGPPTRMVAVQISLRPGAVNDVAVAITESADTVAAALNSTFDVSVAIAEGADSIAASLNSTFNTSIAITESPDIVDVEMLAEALMDIAITESPDAFLADLGAARNIVISIGSEDADTVSIVLENAGSWANCPAVDTDWDECSDPATTWTTCTNPTTDWTVN